MSGSLSLALDIDRLMRRIHANLHPKARSVDTERVGPLGGMILMTIEETEPISVLALARRLARDKAQMTRHVQMLERRGLVARTQNATDKRVSDIRLTERGRALVADFQTALAQVIDELLSDVDDSEKGQLANIIRKMVAD